jgi:hypothetical protein
MLEPANRTLQAGSPEGFVELFEEFMTPRAGLPPFGHGQDIKDALQGITELLLVDSLQSRVSKLRLVVDPSKDPESGRFGFNDIFLAPKGVHAAVLLELRDIRLDGLAFGARGRRLIELPDEEAEEFVGKIFRMTEDALDRLPYANHSEEKEEVVYTTVGRIRQEALEKLGVYSKVLAMGAAREDQGSGALDGRVEIKPGCDILYSFTLVTVGGRKVLWQSGGTIETGFSYSCISV